MEKELRRAHHFPVFVYVISKFVFMFSFSFVDGGDKNKINKGSNIFLAFVFFLVVAKPPKIQSFMDSFLSFMDSFLSFVDKKERNDTERKHNILLVF